MANGRRGRPKKGEIPAKEQAGKKTDEGPIGTEFAENDDALVAAVDLMGRDPIEEAERATQRLALESERPPPPVRASAKQFPCPVCRSVFYAPKDVDTHLGKYGNPGFGVGEVARCRNRRSLFGTVERMDSDHAMMDLKKGGRYKVAAFEKASATIPPPAHADTPAN